MKNKRISDTDTGNKRTAPVLTRRNTLYWLGNAGIGLVAGIGAATALTAPSPGTQPATTNSQGKAQQKQKQPKLKQSSDAAIERLMAGNQRYVANQLIHPDLTHINQRRAETAKEQYPFAIVLTCSDSRVTPEVLFDQGMGDLFVVRVAGNIVDNAVTGSIEYAAEHLGASLVMVLGHERCGAVNAAVNNSREAHIADLARAIKPAVERAKSQPGDMVENAVRENVRLVVRQLQSSQPILASMLTKKRLWIVGGYYDLERGAVSLVQ